MRCGGSGFCDLPTCVTVSRVEDRSRIGSDLGACVRYSSFEFVASESPSLSLLTEASL